MIGITIEHLTCPNFLFNVLPYCILEKNKHSSIVIHVRYIDASPLGRHVMSFVLPYFGITFERLSFRLLDLRDPRGNLLRFTFGYEDLSDCQKKINADSFFQELLKNMPVENQQIPDFLKKAAISNAWDERTSIGRLLMIIHLAGRWTNPLQRNPSIYILFADQRSWMNILKDSAFRKGIILKPVFSFKFNVKFVVMRVIGEGRIRYIRALLKKATISVPKPKENSDVQLILEYYGLFNLNQPQYYSDFAFLQQSSFPGKNVLVASNLNNAPFNQDQFEQMSSKGIRAVAFHAKATATPSIPVFCRWEKDKAPLVECSVNGSNHAKEVLWAKRSLGHFYQLRGDHKALFETHQAKIYLSWFKYDARHIAIAQAMHDNGGIMALYQRATEMFPSVTNAIFCDVFFGFSKQGADIERQSGSRIPYYVVTGYLGDHRFALLKQPAMDIRKQLQAAGAEKILAFFDENSADDERWQTGHEFMRVNYRFLLEKVIADKSLGLVLKPKFPATLRKRLGPVAGLLEQAIQTGRCYFYENSGSFSHYPPVVAALSSDVTIHGCMAAATAGVESALAGVPTVLLDREGWPDSPMNYLGVNKVIFRNWEELWQGCSKYLHNPKDAQGFGDWSAHLDEFDPFRDGRACERMGTFLLWILQGFQDKLDSSQILEQAVQRYRRQWGEDKVFKIG